MIFAHDIFLNLHENYYDFFEWNKKDTIIHLRKIPIIKISSNDLNIIKNNNVILNENITKTYYKKADYFTKNKKENIIILSDNKMSIAINFNNKGNIIKKSSLILEDEENIFRKVNNIKEQNIILKITKHKIDSNLTRNEQDNKKYLQKNIKKLNHNKLIYLYYDCFNKCEKNIKIILDKIILEIKNNNFEIWNKCLNLMNLVYQQNR